MNFPIKRRGSDHIDSDDNALALRRIEQDSAPWNSTLDRPVLLGTDDRLLETRALILQQGHEAVYRASVADLHVVGAYWDPALIVLSHTEGSDDANKPRREKLESIAIVLLALVALFLFCSSYTRISMAWLSPLRVLRLRCRSTQ